MYQKTIFDATCRFDDQIHISMDNMIITKMVLTKKGSHKDNGVHKVATWAEPYYKNIQKDDYKKPYINMTVSNL